MGCINALIGLDFVVSGTLLSCQWGFRRRLPGYQPWQCAPLLRPQAPDSHTANITPRRELVDFRKDWRGWVEEENKERSSRKPCKFNFGHGMVSAEAIVSTCIAVVKIARRLFGVIQSLIGGVQGLARTRSRPSRITGIMRLRNSPPSQTYLSASFSFVSVQGYVESFCEFLLQCGRWET